MVARLAAMPGWCESLPDDKRAMVMGNLLREAETASGRHLEAIARALASFERSDIERTRLLMDLEKQSGPDETAGGAALLDDLEEAKKRGGDRAP